MRSKRLLAIALSAIFAVSAAYAGNVGTAVPAGTASFDSGNCTATFVRSASGIVNETNRTCPGFGVTGIWLQFRPLVGTPNPACDAQGLIVPPFVWSNSETSIAPWFGPAQYNVCVYLFPLTGTILSTEPTGSDVALPLAGKYNVCVSGSYALIAGSPYLGDAGYVTSDAWATPGTQGFQDQYAYLGPYQGNVQVDGMFGDWGAYNATHNYCRNIVHAVGDMNLRTFDGFTNPGDLFGNQQPWYGDNAGVLSYVVKFTGF
jgi:hypothetical protein